MISKINQEGIQEFRKLALDYKVVKLANCICPQTLQPFRCVLEPVSLPCSLFKRLRQISLIWQRLAHQVALNPEFILNTYKNCCSDLMVQSLIEIYKTVLKNSTISLKPKIDLCRYDYFHEQSTDKLKIIQYNNHSVSMFGISSQFQKVCQKFYSNKNLEQNRGNDLFVQGITKIYQQYSLDGIMLFVCQQNENNIYDQKFFIEDLLKFGIKVERVFVEKLNESTNLQQNGELYFEQNKVSVVYFRSAYTQEENLSKQIIEGKTKVNLSQAICIPWVGSELSGQKRIQAQLSKPSVYRQYLTEEEIKLFEETLVETWDFDQVTKADGIIQMMQEEGKQNFILKPNAEGGKNNFFGEQAYEKFKTLTPQERTQYILMRRIYPKVSCHTFISPFGETCSCKATHELSVYGVIQSNPQGKVERSLCDGFLIRTKPEKSDECGLLRGSGGISSLELI